MNKVIDTHLHTWDLQQLDYYWLKGDTSILAKDYFLDEVALNFVEAGVTNALLVQAANSLAESDWLLSLAEVHEWVAGAVIWLPLEKPEAVHAALEKYQPNPYFKGVRHQIHDEQNNEWLLQPTVVESLALLAGKNIPYDLVGTKPAHIETAIKVAERIPSLKMVFDHLNQPPNAVSKEWDTWTGLMKDAAAHANFYAKISGLGTTTAKPFTWDAGDIAPCVEFALKAFGTDRVFCGGDWPVSLLAGSYSYTWQQYQAVFNTLLTAFEKTKVYQHNAEIFYNLLPDNF